MPANLKIWNPEPPPGAGRAAKRARGKDVEWHTVTTREDGGEEWNFSRDPAKAAAQPNAEWEWKSRFGKTAHEDGNGTRKIMDVLRREQEERTAWQLAVELARAKAEKRQKEQEAEQARANQREAHNREEMAARRLMETTVKRLAAAVNRVKVEPAGLKAPMVTSRELRAAFKEFLVDATKDKALKKAWEYRQWLWTDRNTVYLAPVGRRKRGGSGAGGRVTGSGKSI